MDFFIQRTLFRNTFIVEIASTSPSYIVVLHNYCFYSVNRIHWHCFIYRYSADHCCYCFWQISLCQHYYAFIFDGSFFPRLFNIFNAIFRFQITKYPNLKKEAISFPIYAIETCMASHFSTVFNQFFFSVCTKHAYFLYSYGSILLAGNSQDG